MGIGDSCGKWHIKKVIIYKVVHVKFSFMQREFKKELKELILRADQALYEAKSHGRNTVEYLI